MQHQNTEILSIIIIGGVLALVLLLFIVVVLFLYQKKQHRHERELVKVKEEYDQELLRSQLEIQESTLKTIAQELHDNIGQLLSVVKLTLSGLPIEKGHPAAATIENSREILNRAIVDVSNLTKSLHTDRIAQIGLKEAIQFEVDTIRKSGLIKQIEFVANGEERHLNGQKSIFLFRMFQEILNNTLKHSRATHVRVAIYFTDSLFTLKLQDNGVGFNLEEKNKPSASGGVGLKSMINRAKLIGCDFIINSKPGSGTSVSITLPLGEN